VRTGETPYQETTLAGRAITFGPFRLPRIGSCTASGPMAPSSAGPGRLQPREHLTRSNKVGGNPSSTKRWYGVPRGTTDEVSSHVCLDLPTARPSQRSFHLVFESHTGRALVPSPKRSASPRATSPHCNVDSLKVLDPERPIREADIEAALRNVRFWGEFVAKRGRLRRLGWS
jgi:hypothetical protein